ncbi:hypothetical protein [Bradyrhizobium sp. CIR3A]|uniref:hypothetical protein n=1 Tax=Bradyrhizobium sp. CIR3A TaxID=2663838 RepID=UPI0016064BF0|nr:hypothetical protein [Bradyrhizobium sp. CIR3A]MBB4262665.1 hypothetical protein [Bradyrhizobium sp. CIR3A]
MPSAADLERTIATIKERRAELTASIRSLDFREISELQHINTMLPILEEDLSTVKVEEQNVARLQLLAKFGSSHVNGVETIWMKNAAGGRLTAKRMIHGIASTPTINSHKYSLLSRGMMVKLPVPLLSSHKGHATPIGQVVLVRKKADQIYVQAVVFHNEAADYAWKLIEQGETRCFSGAAAPDGYRVQGVVDGVTFYDRWTLGEVSVCRKGANPDCTFEILPSSSLLAAAPGDFASEARGAPRSAAGSSQNLARYCD